MARPRKPTALKKQAGTLQKCRTNQAEPELPPELPPPPDGLSPDVAAAYVTHGQRLLDMRVMTRADVGALVSLAYAYVDREEARAALDDFIKANGSVYYQSGDLIKAHPALATRNEADRRYRGWCQSFGLTPSDRSKVAAVDKPAEKSKMAKVLEMKRA